MGRTAPFPLLGGFAQPGPLPHCRCHPNGRAWQRPDPGEQASAQNPRSVLYHSWRNWKSKETPHVNPAVETSVPSQKFWIHQRKREGGRQGEKEEIQVQRASRERNTHTHIRG